MEVEDWRTVARDRASPRGTSGGRSWRSRTGGPWPGIEPHTERDIRRAELEVEDWKMVARDRASCTERDIRRAELEVEDWKTVARDRASYREGHQEGGVGGRGLEDGGPG